MAEDGESVAVGPVQVSVDNQSQFNVTVYAVRATLRQRVGEAAPSSRSTLAVPASFTDDRGGFSLQVRVVGGSAQYVSDSFTPQHGDRLLLTVQSRIVNSTVVLR
jgi:hypothetical protein